MTTEARSWRDAKIPQWVKDSIDADLSAWKLTAALAWPTEAKPEPLPFGWGDYDHLSGEPQAGDFWVVGGSKSDPTVGEISIKKNPVGGWRPWQFSKDKVHWSGSVSRGLFFSYERDARLYALWLICESCAKKIMDMREAK